MRSSDASPRSLSWRLPALRLVNSSLQLPTPALHRPSLGSVHAAKHSTLPLSMFNYIFSSPRHLTLRLCFFSFLLSFFSLSGRNSKWVSSLCRLRWPGERPRGSSGHTWAGWDRGKIDGRRLPMTGDGGGGPAWQPFATLIRAREAPGLIFLGLYYKSSRQIKRG